MELNNSGTYKETPHLLMQMSIKWAFHYKHRFLKDYGTTPDRNNQWHGQIIVFFSCIHISPQMLFILSYVLRIQSIAINEKRILEQKM